MPKYISLIVSAYCEGNDNSRNLKQIADKNMEEARVLSRSTPSPKNQKRVKGLTREAQAKYSIIRRPGTDYLKQLFADTGMWTGKHVHPYVGLFDGVIEPSTIMQIPFNSEAEWRENERSVKSKLIAFGQHFSQTTVHLAGMSASPSSGVGFGESINEDVTRQVRYYGLAKKLRGNWGNIWYLCQKAKDVGMRFLSAGYFGHEVLLYSIGGTDGCNSRNRAALVDAWEELKPTVSETFDVNKWGKGEMHLTNYGADDVAKGEYGASHTYEEALEMLAQK